ncbi:MAG: hypothetical protein GTO02_11590 [Candidatus Dadabacteria bacterium]|nr:hypothetical protein [Candidatus Dadabacteria bacterium]NIQ14998.1 hypothetical protein [Candidatus Dadabacteria bacterium]
MKFIIYIFLALIIALPSSSFAGEAYTQIPDTDEIASAQVTSPYDLRNRKTYIQVTNDGTESGGLPQVIHVQIFQHDRGCSELNFFDTLTANDTVVYDMDNIIKNDGSPVPASLLDDSYGYVVITTYDGDPDDHDAHSLIGNFRIIDDNDYEYRSNMIGVNETETTDQLQNFNLIANFNTVDGAMYADVIGYAYEGQGHATVTNIDEGYSFDIFTFDLDEEPLSCDRRNFACGNVMNYGINEDYMASRGNDLLCPGGGLSDLRGGYVSFENALNDDLDGAIPDNDDHDTFFGWIGINNNNGTGSMDIWWYRDPIKT